ncbi:MAG: 50S ribosomal protein L11 methyltransferase [Sulfurovaceae bacterium]|nr:50S ribosomal protein L11 methyltransferase [Sulfurovaceae bacterium]
MNEEYYELIIKTNENYVDALSDAVAMLCDDGIEIDGNNIIVRSENDLSYLQTQLEDITTPLKINVTFNYSKKANADWMAQYQASIEPIEAGEFYIFPSWHEPKNDRINITIDPALAFGSGHHATTASCLEMITKYVKQNDSVIDVGCGSGILGLAAKKKGALSVDLCDTDPLAVESCKENFQINNETYDSIWEGSANKASKEYDITIANIIADVLVMIAKDLKKITKTNGLLILSGILDKKETLVTEAYNDLKLLNRKLKDEWVTLVYQKEINVK